MAAGKLLLHSLHGQPALPLRRLPPTRSWLAAAGAVAAAGRADVLAVRDDTLVVIPAHAVAGQESAGIDAVLAVAVVVVDDVVVEGRVVPAVVLSTKQP